MTFVYNNIHNYFSFLFDGLGYINNFSFSKYVYFKHI